MKRTVLVLVVSVVFVGCSSRLLTNTPRSAIEQLLLSAAVDKALEKFQLPELAGKKVFVDFSNLKAYDQEYIKVASRARMAGLGAVLVEKGRPGRPCRRGRLRRAWNRIQERRRGPAAAARAQFAHAAA